MSKTQNALPSRVFQAIPLSPGSHAKASRISAPCG